MCPACQQLPYVASQIWVQQQRITTTDNPMHDNSNTWQHQHPTKLTNCVPVKYPSAVLYYGMLALARSQHLKKMLAKNPSSWSCLTAYQRWYLCSTSLFWISQGLAYTAPNTLHRFLWAIPPPPALGQEGCMWSKSCCLTKNQNYEQVSATAVLQPQRWTCWRALNSALRLIDSFTGWNVPAWSRSSAYKESMTVN